MSFRSLALVLGLALAGPPHGAAVAGQSHGGPSHDHAAADHGEHSSRQDDRYWYSASRSKAVSDLLASREGRTTSVQSGFQHFLTRNGSSWPGQPTRPESIRVAPGDLNGDGYQYYRDPSAQSADDDLRKLRTAVNGELRELAKPVATLTQPPEKHEGDPKPAPLPPLVVPKYYDPDKPAKESNF